MSFAHMFLLIVLLAGGVSTESMAQQVKSEEPDVINVTLISGGISAGSTAQEAKKEKPDLVHVTLISAFVGLASGLFSSILAPYINWGIERRRYKLDYRRGIIANARGNAHPGFNSKTFLETHSFFQLKDLLSQSLVRRLELGAVGGTQEDQEQIRIALLKEIAEIERKWFL